LRRVFADIHAAFCTDENLSMYYKLGYTLIACEKFSGRTSEMTERGVSVVGKVVIDASSISDLREALGKVKYRESVIAVHPESVEVARWAAHDGRVDVILLTPSNIRIFDKRQFSTMKYYSKPLEIRIPHLLYSNSEVKSYFYRRLNMLVRFKLGFALGTSASSFYELLHPLVAVKALKTLYDIPEKIALLALTDIPRQIIFRKLNV